MKKKLLIVLGTVAVIRANTILSVNAFYNTATKIKLA